jgi:hypothetical protein
MAVIIIDGLRFGEGVIEVACGVSLQEEIVVNEGAHGWIKKINDG